MTGDEALLAALGHTQQIYRALAELSDLTTELEQATGQNDPVTVNLFLKLRAEPLGRAWEHKRQLRRLCAALPGEEGERLLQLLSDQAADPGPQEAPLLQQVRRNQQLLERILQADKRASLRLGRERSFYQQQPAR